MNATRNLGKTEAVLYLDAAGWDAAKAVAAAKADDAFEAARVAEVNAQLAAVASTRPSVVVHVESARNLHDVGILAVMDVYVVATLWAGAEILAQGMSNAVKASGGTSAWRWDPQAGGSSLQLPLRDDRADDLALSFAVMAPNDVLADTHVGTTKRFPLRRLVAAVHDVGVDTGGDLRLSIKAPDYIKRDAVRAVAVSSDDNPFLQPVVLGRADYPPIPLVDAVAVRVEDRDTPRHTPPFPDKSLVLV